MGDLATVLPRLDILPLLIGLDLKAAYEDGVLYRPDILDVDVKELRGQFARASQAAFNLAMNINYPTPATVRSMLALAHGRALSLTIGAGVVTPETIGILLAKGHSHALSLASLVPEAPADQAEVEEPAVEAKEDEGGDEKEEAKEEEKEASEEEAAE